MRSTRRSLQALGGGRNHDGRLAACSSEGRAERGCRRRREFTIAMVTHEAPGDTFWDKIRNGAEQAAEDHGITLTTRTTRTPVSRRRSCRTLSTAGWTGWRPLCPPDAIGPTVQDAVDANIPTVAFSSRHQRLHEYGIAMYFGSDEDLGARPSARRSARKPRSHRLRDPGAGAGPARGTLCRSASTFPTPRSSTSTAATFRPFSRPSAPASGDASITNVVTLGADIALAAQQSAADARQPRRTSSRST